MNIKTTTDHGETVMTDLDTGIVLTWMEDDASTLKCESIGTASPSEYIRLAQQMTTYAYEQGLLHEGNKQMIMRQIARKSIGDQVRKAREAAGLTLRELAQKVGLAHNHIGRIEAGRYNVTVDTLAIIAEALGVTLEI